MLDTTDTTVYGAQRVEDEGDLKIKHGFWAFSCKFQYLEVWGRKTAVFSVLPRVHNKTLSQTKMVPNKMTQWYMHLPPCLILISRTHMVEGENEVPQVSLWPTLMCLWMCVPPNRHKHMQFKIFYTKIKIVSNIGPTKQIMAFICQVV